MKYTAKKLKRITGLHWEPTGTEGTFTCRVGAALVTSGPDFVRVEGLDSCSEITSLMDLVRDCKRKYEELARLKRRLRKRVEEVVRW